MGILDRATTSFLLKKADKSMQKGDYKGALKNYLKILKTKLKLKEEKGLEQLYRKMADCYSKIKTKKEEDKIKNTKKAAGYYEKSADLFLKLNDHHNAALTFTFAGNCYESLGDDKKAAEIDKKAAEMFSEIGENYEASHSFVESAQYYEKVSDYEKAAYCYGKAGEIDINLNDVTRASESYKSVGKCYKNLGKYEKVIDIYNLTSGLDEKTGNYLGIAYSHEQIASCYESLKDYKNAIKHYLKSVEINKREGKSKDAIRNYRSIGKCYGQMEDYKGELDYLLKAASLAMSVRDKELEGASSKEVASCYEKLNDYDNAIENYILSADANMSSGKGTDAVESYNRAIDLNLKVAKEVEKNPERASTYYTNAAECYEKLRDDEKASEFYFKSGEMESAANNTGKAKSSFLKAADGYLKIKNIEKAVECYTKAEAYEKVAENCDKLAENLSKEKDYLAAGKWLLTASWCYDRITQQSKVREYCDKIRWQYETFIDTEKKKEKPDANKMAFAHKIVGEVNIRTDLFRNALPYLEKSFELYQELKDKQQSDIVGMQLSFVRANLLTKEANYSEATKLLNDSIEYFKNIDKKDMDEFYKDYLEKRVKDAESLIEAINVRPSVSLIVIQPSTIKIGAPFTLNGVITNKGVQTINKIAFQTYAPQKIDVTNVPEEIPELKPKESKKIQLEITSNVEGKFDFKPLEVLYHDKDNRRYMKASNKITLNVEPEEPEPEIETGIGEVEDKLKTAFSEVKSPIILLPYSHEKYTEMLAIILKVYKDIGVGGVYLSVSKPYTHTTQILTDRKISIDDIYFIDCVSYMAGKGVEEKKNVVFVENPASLEEISMYVDKSMAKVNSKQRFLVIDSLSGLLIYNEDRAVEELIHFLINRMRIENISGVILTTEDDLKKPVVRTILNECDKEINV